MIKYFYLTYWWDLRNTIYPTQSGLKIIGNEGVLNISQRKRTKTSLLDGLVSYQGHL